MNRKINKLFTPISLPIIFFTATIIIGTVLLHSSFSHYDTTISWLDALFTATSAACVTGLKVVDTGGGFTRTGQTIIMLLIQLGGLGIMSFTSLAFYLLRKRISLTDRIAVGQSLLYDSKFNLGVFLIQIVTVVFVIELSGALILFAIDSHSFSPFSAVFHSISAFSNAGFSLNADSLMRYKSNWSINLIFMLLIILGGIGFSVIIEGKSKLLSILRGEMRKNKNSWHFKTVVKTSLFLIGAGWIFLFLSEFGSVKEYLPIHDVLLTSLFQSITSRTAGFNTLNIASMTNLSLIFLILLMFIGGAPGSCAGGVKITTFRVLSAFIKSKIRGREQVIIGDYAVDRESINKSLTLLFFSFVIIFIGVIALNLTEGGSIPHTEAKGQFLEILFEAVSAFGTVGLSTGLTEKLSSIGKVIIIVLMFVGRLGPLVLLASIQSTRTKLLYSIPEEKLAIG